MTSLNAQPNAILKFLTLITQFHLFFVFADDEFFSSHNTKASETDFLSFEDSEHVCKPLPFLLFSFYLKEHYYTVHGIGEKKRDESKGKNGTKSLGTERRRR